MPTVRGTLHAAQAFVALATALVLAGCSSDRNAQQERAMSLAGSAEMATSEWLAGAIPTHFAQQALDTAAQRLSASLAEARSSAESGDREAGNLLDPLASLTFAVDRIGNALAVADRDRAKANLDDLRAARQAMRPGPISGQ